MVGLDWIGFIHRLSQPPLELDPKVDTSLGDCLVFAPQAVSGITQ